MAEAIPLFASQARLPAEERAALRGRRLRGPGLRVHFKRWIKAAGMHYQPSPLPARPDPRLREAGLRSGMEAVRRGRAPVRCECAQSDYRGVLRFRMSRLQGFHAERLANGAAELPE